MSGILDVLRHAWGGVEPRRPLHPDTATTQESVSYQYPAGLDKAPPPSSKPTPFKPTTPYPSSNSRSSRSRISSAPIRIPSSIPEVPVDAAVVSPIIPATHPGDTAMSPLNLADAPGNMSVESGGGEGDTSTSSAWITSDSSFSAPAELLFGPQPIPFVFRRRQKDVDELDTPSKAPTIVSTPNERRRALKVLDPASLARGERRRMESDSESEVGEISEELKKPEPVMSQWRKEQLQRAAPIRCGTVRRPIPTLYGPLSLPYARNPSGVDATVADETAYLSHVYGLRPASVDLHGDPKAEKTTAVPTVRLVSVSTNGSSDDSALISKHTRTAPAVASASTVSLATAPRRPVVIRDPNQFIGLLKEPAVKATHSLQKPLDAQAETAPRTFPDSAIKSVSATPISLYAPTSEAMNPKDVAPSAILKAQFYAALSAPAMPSISDASPVVSRADPFEPLFAQAIQSAQGYEEEDTRAPGADEQPAGDVSRAIADDIAQYIVQPAGQRDSQEPIRAAGPDTAQRQGHPPSKADSNENWRTRTRANSTFAHDPPHLVQFTASPHTLQTPKPKAKAAAQEPTDFASVGGQIMTIDSLFEKFGHGSPPEVPLVKVNPPTPAAGAPMNSPLKPLKPSKQTSVNPPAPKQSGSSHKLDPIEDAENITPDPTASTSRPQRQPLGTSRGLSSARGTPDAGRHLKKGARAASRLATAAGKVATPSPESDRRA